MRKHLETKLSYRNLIEEINTSAVPLVKPFLKWMGKALREMAQMTWKIITMH